MAIVDFRYSGDLADSFIRFGEEVYRDDPKWIPPSRKEMLHQMSPAFFFNRPPDNDARHFLALNGGRVVGRVSAMVNGEMKDPEGGAVGTVGFFDCIDDQAAADDLLGAAVTWLQEKGIRRIWGPMNYTVWHGFRLMVRGFDRKPFLGEPYNHPYYQELFARFGFTPLHTWDTLEVTGRETLERMIVRGEARHRLLVDRGYRFESVDPKKLARELPVIHRIITDSFSSHPGFTRLSPGEFARIHAGSGWAMHPRMTYFAYDPEGRSAGFAAALLEISDVFRAARRKRWLPALAAFAARRRKTGWINFYIGGITPQEEKKGSGLGRAGFYRVIRGMLDLGHDKLMLTLRLQGNTSRALPGRDVPHPQREYCLYEVST
jgi:GNAT superfamily N-acetyltransferase